MIKFLKKRFEFEFDLKNSGRTRIKIIIRKIAGTICSKFIFNYSRNLLLFEKTF